MNTANQTVKLLLVDDEDIMLQGLLELLSSEPSLQIVGTARNGQQALDGVQKHHPDVVLMDLRMPFMDGIAATGAIRQQWPQTKVLILTTMTADEQIVQALHQGADGYLLKNMPLQELTRSIHAVHQGYMQFGPGVGQRMMAHLVAPPPASMPSWSQLTEREQEVAQLIAKGATNREIAKTLFIADKTVKNHVSNILNRLQMRDRTQIAVWVTQVLGPRLQMVG